MKIPTQSDDFKHLGNDIYHNSRKINDKVQAITRPIKPSRNKFHHDRVAVSEAIGTILLLAIAIVLAGVVSIWAYNIEHPEEMVAVDLTSKMETNVIEIKHIGGEPLDERDTKITIFIDSSKYYHYDFLDSENNDLKDGEWTIGEVWVKDISDILSLFTDPKIEVYVRDMRTNEILLTQTVHEGAILNLPDLAIAAEDIEFDFQDEIPIIGRWVNITATVWNIGNTPAKNVIVRLFDDNILLKRNNQDYQVLNISNSPGNNYKSAWVNYTTSYWGKRAITVKVYSSISEINYRNNYATRELYIEPKLPTFHGPDLEVSNFDIILSNSYPVHGEEVQITVIVHNTGDEDVLKGTTVKVHLFDDKGQLDKYYQFSIGLTAGLNHPCNFGTWDTRPGGISIITVDVDTDKVVNETDETNNNASRPIQILPTILVVDDDEASTGKFDVFEEMESNLKASGVTHKWTKTDDELGTPNYDSGQYPLKNYDIIIWMTGYKTSNTLTVKNIEALNQSLNNGSYLWLIGQDILTDLTNKFGDGDDKFEQGEFAYDYLGVYQYNLSGTPELLEGLYDDPITNGSLLNTSSIVESEDRGVKLIPKTLQNGTSDEIAGMLINDTEFEAGWNNSFRYFNASKGFKIVFFGWEFAGINNVVDRVNLTYHVLKWFNWSISIGKDFAVSSEEFSTITPNFMDKLTISATIRNNGPLPGDNVRVMFYITGPEGEEEPILEHPDNKDNPQMVFLPGDGGEVTVTKQWLAVSVGQHNFRVMVDPYNEFDEVSEENNDVEYTELFVTELFIRYNILVVDDDNSTNNDLSGKGANVTQNMTNTLDFLKYEYDTYIVTGGFTPEQGPNVTIMKFYNTVIWLTGNETINTLKQGDQENLTAYLVGDYYEAQFLGETKVNLWLIGQDILDDLDGAGNDMVPQNQFVQDILQVSKYSTGSGMPDIMDGVKYDPITHGISYPLNTNAFNDNADTFVPNYTAGATGVFWQNSAHTNYNSLKHNATRYNIIFYPWEFSFIDNPVEFGGGGAFGYQVWDTPGLETYQAEISYLNLHWLGYPESRIELKTSKIDIELSNYNPMLGNSYILNTNIYNYGMNETSVVIRFFDGNTILDTKALYVPADSNSSIEVIWVPLYAGNRTLNVAVDTANDVSEIFEVLNNNASLTNLHVYFFYDDLENGAGNWEHDSFIIRINGESPLDFIDTPVYSEIDDTFAILNGFEQNTSEYHSHNVSYYGQEPTNGSGKEIKYMETNPFNLENVTSARLSFYHKYDIELGYNGALVRIGTYNQSNSTWKFKYAMPLQVYSSNLDFNNTEKDDFNQEMRWCWNGISASGKFDWEFAEFDLLQFIGEPMVKVNFTFYIYGPRPVSNASYGWWVDDVVVKVSRGNLIPLSPDSADQWELTTNDSHSGSYSWWNHNATSNSFAGGLDNSLYSRPLDLTNANDATLSAYFKFNINKTNGRPPDGFRVEISDDNGLTWYQLNLGFRAAWGVAGDESDAEDGKTDGKSYTGLDVYGEDSDNDYWVESNTLTRLNCNLTGWRGSVIMLRFRVITASDDNPYFGGTHIEDNGVGFGGFYIDDVIIYGNSLLTES